MRLFQFLIILSFAFLTLACASISTMQTAQTVPKGEIQLAVQATGTGAKGNADTTTDPNLNFALRYGISDSADIGFRTNLLGAQLSAKYQLIKSNFDLAIAFEAGYQWIWTGGINKPRSHLITAQIPILMETHINNQLGIAFGPKILGTYTLAKNKRTDIWQHDALYLGLQLGLPLRLTKQYHLMPEFNIYTNVINRKKQYFNTILWHAGVSVFFNAL